MSAWTSALLSRCPHGTLTAAALTNRDDHAQNLLRHCPLGVLSSVQQLALEVRRFQELGERFKGSRLRFHAEGDGLIRRVPKPAPCGKLRNFLPRCRDGVALLVGRRAAHAGRRTAHRVAVSKPQLVWLDGRAERTRSACVLAAGWVHLMSRSLLEMWSDRERRAQYLACACR